MPAQNATVLKSYYETGDKPTQQQFADLVDSLQEARDNALTALTTAVSAQVVATSALSAANSRVLRAGDTMTGALFIDGSADAVQLTLKGHSTQTNSILLIQNDAALSLLTVGNTGNLTAVGNLILGTAGAVSRLKVPSSGVITLTDNGDTSFVRLQFGGTTASFPALRRTSAALDVRLADDSAYAALTSGFLLATFQDTSTNTAPTALEAYHDTTAGTPAAGDGVSLDLTMDSSTTDRQLGARLTAEWTTATHGTRTSKLRWYIVNSASTTEVLAASAANISFLNGSTPLITQGTITTDLKNLEGTVTWNAGGVTFAGWKLNVTNTASAAASALLDLQVGAASKFFVGLTGNLLIQAGTITTNIQQVSSTATWNAGGVAFTSWKLNVTDSASDVASKLLDLQVGGTPKFSFNKAGVLLIGFTAPVKADSFEGGLQLGDSIAPSNDPAAGVALWADGTSDEWMYRSVASGEGSGRSNRVHNRLDQAVGTGTDYTLTGSTARVDFGTTDAQVDIPNGGTYLILATIQFVGDAAGAGDELHAKIRNSTDAVDVGFESTTTMPSNNGFVTMVLERRHVNNLGAAQTLQIFAHNATSARGTITSTKTSIKFIRCY